MHDVPHAAPYQIFPALSISEAPDPPVPEEVNLESCSWMKLHGDRLADSTFGITSSRAGIGCAVLIWWYAFKQPGASIPNDQRILAHVCGLRWRDAEWLRIKEEALDKFYLCNNNRLYHPFLSEVAIEAWEQHHKKSAAGKKGASRRWKEGIANGDAIATPMALHGRGEEIRVDIEVPKGTLSGTKPRPRPKAPVKEIIEYLNKTAGTNFSPSTKATINMLNARWQENKNLKRYKLVIDYLCSKWLKDDQMAGYLRPATIFQASKFEGYAEDGIRWAEKTGYTQEENE